jgi:predicted RNA-binding Zn-ribbon protein involved in translation (DUF1610 family)
MAVDKSPGFYLVRNRRGDYYDTQQVCENGHQITDRYNDYPQRRKDYCPECGAKTIHKCLNSNTEIKGYHVIPGAVGGGSSVQDYCDKCGKQFPWAVKKAGNEEQVRTEEPPLTVIELIAARLHVVAKQLRTRHNNRHTLDISDEYDVQDLVHGLLRLFLMIFELKNGLPTNAGGAARMDFLLKQESIVLETKKTSPHHSGKEIGEELIIDIAKYRQHPSCKKLFCIVYDPEERIPAPRGLETDLSRNEGNLEVKVTVTPRRS